MMRTKTAKSRWPFRPTARARYKRLASAALAAYIYPPATAPPGYNDVCFALWRTLRLPQNSPSSEELVEALEGLGELLKDAAVLPDGSMDVTGPRAEILLAARRRLDVLYGEAIASGVILE